MFIIASDIIINVDNVSGIFINDKGHLQCDVDGGAYILKNIPDNALQQVAMAAADGKRFLEMEDASITVEQEDNDDIGSDIE